MALVRGAFEYQGQKCSAASRAYIPDTLWPEVRERMVAMMADIRMGDVADFRNFMGAVIDKKGVRQASRGTSQTAQKATGVEIVAGGGADDTEGYFVEPTLLQAEDPQLPARCARRSSARC